MHTPHIVDFVAALHLPSTHAPPISSPRPLIPDLPSDDDLLDDLLDDLVEVFQ